MAVPLSCSIAIVAQGAVFGGVATETQWVRLIGTSEVDVLNSVAADQVGNVFAAGGTFGVLGAESLDNGDALLMKHSAAGDLLWTRQFGSVDGDEAHGIAVDNSGSAFVVGRIGSSPTGIGNSDAFLRKYNGAGNLEWSRLLASSGDDIGNAISLDQAAKRIYVSGHTRGNLNGANFGGLDAFIAQYDFDGTLLWTRQFGTTSVDHGSAISADGLGSVYVGGTTHHGFDSPPSDDDAFVARYDASGNLLWKQEIATAGDDRCLGISADSLGNVFVTGNTSGDPDEVGADVAVPFVSKFGSDGILRWTKQIGVDESGTGRGVVTDGLGNAYFAGGIDGEVMLGNITSQGTLLWLDRFGSDDFTAAFGISYSAPATLQVAGFTTGNFGGVYSGRTDGFVMSVREIPEPGSQSLLMAALAVFSTLHTRNFRRRRAKISPAPSSSTF